MFDHLLAHIGKFISLDAREQEILLSHCQHRTLKKKEFVLREGQICTANYFILQGCMRMYVITEKGTEQIIQFGIDRWWISDYNSLDAGRPSGFNIQAVEDCQLVVIDKKNQADLLTQLPKLETYFRIVFQKAYAASLMRVQYIYCLSAEERWLQFSRNFPGFVQRVPQYMLASFLGFTPEFLSKARGRKSKH